MASQTDVQQLIQGLSQGSNNGNPNTAYNNAPGLPMADANGNWYLQNLPTAASINLQRSEAGGGIPNLFASLPPLTSNGSGGTPWPVTPTAPIVAPGTEVLPAASAGGGGGTAPLQVPPAVSLGGRGGDNTALPGNLLGGMPPVSSYQGALNTGGTTNQYLQDTGGSINWQQLVDVAGDALGLPGNWYLNGTGKWDVSNILTSLGSKVTGLPIGTLLSQIGKQVAAGGDVPMVPSWLEKLAFDHYMDNAENKAENKADASEQAFDRKMMLGDIGNQTQFADPGRSPGALRTPGNIAGAGVVGGYFINPDTGKWEFSDAGQQMFDGMKGLTGSSKAYQSGGDIYGHKYEK